MGRDAFSAQEFALARVIRRGDSAELVQRPVVVRADSAGCTQGFVTGCRARNIGFAVAALIYAALFSRMSRAE